MSEDSANLVGVFRATTIPQAACMGMRGDGFSQQIFLATKSNARGMDVAIQAEQGMLIMHVFVMMGGMR